MLTYYNLVDHNDPHNKVVETWGLFKRNASSYINDLQLSQQGMGYAYRIDALETYSSNQHDYNVFIPTDQTLKNFDYELQVNPSNLKICIRDPMHRYCSALVMINYDLTNKAHRDSTMDPYYHNGGREEIVQTFPGMGNEQRIRGLYTWREWVRSLRETFFQHGANPVADFTFGESHLDPSLTLAALLPFMHPQAEVEFVDLKRWTEYTTEKLNIAETLESVNRWNTPKLENTRHKPAQPGLNMFKVLQQELSEHYTRDTRAIVSPQNWRPTFENWLEPEMFMYNFMKNNPVIAYGSAEATELVRILVHLLEDPYFLARNWLVWRNFANPQVQERLPKELVAVINSTSAKVFDYTRDIDSRRHQK